MQMQLKQQNINEILVSTFIFQLNNSHFWQFLIDI